MESLIPALVAGRDAAAHRPGRPRHHVLVCDPERVRSRAADLVRTAEEFLAASWSTAAEAGQAPIDLGASSFRDLAEVETAARDPRPAVVDDGRLHAASRGRRRARHPRRDDRRAVPGDSAEGGRAGAHLAPRGLAGRRHLRRARARPARRRPVHRGRPRRPAGARHRRGPGRRADARDPGQPRVRLRLPRRRPGAAHRARPDRPARHEHARRGQDAGPPAQRRRPGAAAARRPRRPRAARHRPLHRDDQPHGQRRSARLPDRRVRAVAAEPAAGPAVRAHRLPRPAHPLRRRRGARRCPSWAAPTGRTPRARRARRSSRSPPS